MLQCRMSDPSPLISFLAERDVACPVCRYNLRGLNRASCPECNAPLRLEVGSPSLVLGPFLVAVVSFSLGAGFDLVVGILMVTVALVFGQPGASATWIGPVVLGGTLLAAGLACLGGILWLARRRVWWNRLGPRRQRTAAACVFAGVGLAHLALGVSIVSMLN